MEPVRRDMELLSSSMATVAHIRANPESFALYFMMGVCLGLLMALCLLVAGIACRARRRRPPPADSERPCRSEDKEAEEEDEEEYDEEESVLQDGGAEEAELSAAMRSPDGRPGGPSHGTLRSVDVFASAQELEKARRLEERERIVREIWRNGQPDLLLTGTGTLGRVLYH